MPSLSEQAVEHFFRTEAGRLHATLLRELGTEHFALAEDIAQETLLRALRAWALGGIPDNPAAWITRVAINLARDQGRHLGMRKRNEPALTHHHEQLATPSEAWEAAQVLRDDTLRLLFICCHPALPPDAQIILALRTLCGLSVREIARAFYRSEAAVEKQLTRTKQRVQDLRLPFVLPPPSEMTARLDRVLETLYLLFNEGHHATEGETAIRLDLCQEAVRLGDLLCQHPAGDTPRTHALQALFLLTAARFPARLGHDGTLVRLEEQDRSRWDQQLISRGLHHLEKAGTGSKLTDFHLQAGIAALHCLAASRAATPWADIVRHYDALWAQTGSPVVALNRAVALAELEGPERALQEIAAIPGRERLEAFPLYYAVLGDLHLRQGNEEASRRHYEEARRLSRLRPEGALFARLASGDTTSA